MTSLLLFAVVAALCCVGTYTMGRWSERRRLSREAHLRGLVGPRRDAVDRAVDAHFHVTAAAIPDCAKEYHHAD